MGIFGLFGKAATGDKTPSRKAPAVIPEIAAAFGVMGMLSDLNFNGSSMDGYVCVPVAGESFYQESLHELRRCLETLRSDDDKSYGFTARLSPEPTNAHDPNAIAVEWGTGNRKIGYVRADIARDYQTFLRSLEGPVQCAARLVGGTAEKPHIGVVLDFTDLAALKQKIGTTR